MNNLKSFEIRWGDLDPNRHVANAAISSLMNDRRMSFLRDNGITQSFFERMQIGPAILNESFYYLKEILPGSKVFIDVELLGNTIDFKYNIFSHSLFNHEGMLAVYSTVMFTWFDLKTRKSIVPPDELLNVTSALHKSEDYKVLTEDDIKNMRIQPRSIQLKTI
jgi:acyl-CoA thioester hydrolase